MCVTVWNDLIRVDGDERAVRSQEIIIARFEEFERVVWIAEDHRGQLNRGGMRNTISQKERHTHTRREKKKMKKDERIDCVDINMCTCFRT